MFRPRWMAPAVFVALVAIVMAVRLGPLFRAPLLEEGDLAVNALQVRNAKRLHEIYGNYSRYEFHHPGPAFFYVYATAETLLFDGLRVVPSPGNAHLIAIVCLQFAFLTATLWLIATRFPWRPLAPLALLAAAIWIRQHPEIAVSVWPPHVIAIPFLCFLVACTCVAAGDIAVLPVAVVAGGFLFHSHVAQALFVMTIGPAAIALGVRARKVEIEGLTGARFAGWRRTVLLAGATGALFAIPLLVDVVQLGARSNTAAILGRFSANLGQHASFRQSVLFFVTYPSTSREQDAMLTANAGPAIADFVHHHWMPIAASVAVLFAPAILRIVVRRHVSADERRMVFSAPVLLAIAVVDCLIWGMAQADAVRHYNGVFYYAVYFYAALFGLAIVARALMGRWGGRAELGVAGLAAVVLAFGLRAQAASPTERGIPIERAVDTALSETRNQAPKFLVVARGNWQIVAAVALDLRRRGVEFFVPDWWSFMFPAPGYSRLAKRRTNAETWWIAPTGAGGLDLTSGLALYRRPAPLDPNGARIDFTMGAAAFRYVVTGVQDGDFISTISAGGMTTNERHVRLRFVPLPTSDDVEITFDVASALPDHATMPARVLLNGQEVGRVAVQGRAEVRIDVPRARWNESQDATLEVDFPDARAARSAARPDYTGWTGWRIWSIRFDPEQSSESSASAPSSRVKAAGKPKEL